MTNQPARLTDIAYYARKFFKWGLIAVIILFILKALISAGLGWYQKNNPKKPKPTLSFGRLLQLQFPQSPSPFKTNQISYLLETVEGGLPLLPEIGHVYPLNTPNRSLLSYQRMIKTAESLDFKTPPVKINQTDLVWRFTDPDFPARALDYHEINGRFKLAYDYQDEPSVLTPDNPNLPAPSKAESEARSFLSRHNLLTSDLEQSKPKIQFFKNLNNQLVPASSFSEANALLVNFPLPGLDEQEIFEPNPQKTLVSILIGPHRDNKFRFLEANYFYQTINRQLYATYPLKTAQAAFEDLKAGRAYLAGFNGLRPQTTIRQIFLAYYLGDQPQEYLQPIIVFQGDNDFLAYVPAITNEWTKQ